MKTKNIYQHGELLLVEVGKMPTGKVKKVSECVVAHSETGHHHVVESKAEFETIIDKEDLYLHLFEPAKLVHQKTHDKHRTLKLKPAIYKIFKKTEYDPFAELVKEIKD